MPIYNFPISEVEMYRAGFNKLKVYLKKDLEESENLLKDAKTSQNKFLLSGCLFSAKATLTFLEKMEIEFETGMITIPNTPLD